MSPDETPDSHVLEPSAVERYRNLCAKAIEAELAERERLFLEELAAEDAAEDATKSLGRQRSLRLLAEGDSWFDYPLPPLGVVKHVKRKTAGLKILNVALAGDLAQRMLNLRQRRNLARLLRTGGFEGLLFSGGGNDIVGEEMVLWIRDRGDGMSPAEGLHLERFDAVLGIVMAAYEDLVTIRDRACGDRRCPIFIHGYDFAQPTGKGVCGLGPWLRPSLVERGWVDPAEGAELIATMLERFSARLKRFAADQRDVVFIDTQGTLDPDLHWANELHPNRDGFAKVADLFVGTLKDSYPGRFVEL